MLLYHLLAPVFHSIQLEYRVHEVVARRWISEQEAFVASYDVLTLRAYQLADCCLDLRDGFLDVPLFCFLAEAGNRGSIIDLLLLLCQFPLQIL